MIQSAETEDGNVWPDHDSNALAIAGGKPISPDSVALGKASSGIGSPWPLMAFRHAFPGD